MKGMGKYNAIETDQGVIELSNLIQTICHLQYDDKKRRYVRSRN